jgi:beta-lactamase class A
MIRCIVIPFILIGAWSNAQTTIAGYYIQDKEFNNSLGKIVSEIGLDKTFDVGDDGTEQISLAVIDLNGSKPVFGGVNADNFIYPASVYKMYVAMEILNQVNQGKMSYYDPYVVKSPNDVDKTKEISYDPRPLLRDGDTVTVHYLLDLMITRSDNAAANCMIDIATRASINKTMLSFNWKGSEVTRKFLKRKFEDPGYDTVRSTATCALHAADFMYRIEKNLLVNPWVSMQLKSFLGMQLDTTKLSQGLPASAAFYHKSGWWSFYTHDVGIVDDGDVKYIIALFMPVTEDDARPLMKQLSSRVYDLIKQRNSGAEQKRKRTQQ